MILTMRQSHVKNVWGLKEEKSVWNWCPCLKNLRNRKVEHDPEETATPVLTIALPLENSQQNLDNGATHSLKSLPLPNSSGSESSGYFTPPLTERSTKQSSAEEQIDTLKAVTKLPSQSSNDQDAESGESDIAVLPLDQINENYTVENFPPVSDDNVSDVTLENECFETKNEIKEDFNTNNLIETVDEVDRKSITSSLNELDLTPRPFLENKPLSKSEANLERTLPILVDRKYLSSAPLTNGNTNGRFLKNFDETPITPMKTSLPGALETETIPTEIPVQEEQKPDIPSARRLSRRSNHIPLSKRSSRSSSRQAPSARSRRHKDPIDEVLTQLESNDWEITILGLKGLLKLARYSPDTLEPNMHIIVGSVARHIKNLRSQVARAACQASKELFTTCCHYGLEPEAEEMVGPLLHRTADTNKFIRSDANNALDAFCEHMPTPKFVAILTTKGCTHQNGIVRAATARLMDEHLRKHGVEKIFSSGKETRDKLLLAGANGLTEGNLEARKYAKSLLRQLKTHSHFNKALIEAVPPHTLRHISKTLNAIK